MKNYILIKGTEYKLALSDDEAYPIERHFSAENIKDFEKGVKKDYSKEIEAKGNREVDNYFAEVGVFGDAINNYIGLQEIEVVLFINYSQIFDGVMMIRSATTLQHFNTYSLYLFSKEINMLNEADKYKLSALDFSDLPTLEFNHSGIFQNWGVANPNVRLVLADRGAETANPRDFDISEVTPFFKIGYLAFKIAQLLGLNFIADYFTDASNPLFDSFRKIIIGKGGIAGAELSQQQILDSTGEIKGGLSQVNLIGTMQELAQNYVLTILNTVGATQLYIDNILIPNSGISQNNITIPYQGLISLQIEGSAQIELAGANFVQSAESAKNRAIINVRCGGVFVATIISGAPAISGNSATFQFSKTVQFHNLQTDANLTFTAIVRKFENNTYSDATFEIDSVATNTTFAVNFDSVLFQSASEKMEWDMEWNWNATVPDMTCGDFLRNMIKLFGISWYQDGNDVYFYLFRDFYKPKNQAKNWDGKEDNSLPIVHTILQNEQPKNVTFKFEESGDFDQELYFERTGQKWGEGNKVNPAQFAKQTEDVKIDFSPVSIVKYPNQIGFSALYLPRFLNEKNEPNDGGVRIGFDTRTPDGATPVARIVNYGGTNPAVSHLTVRTISEISDDFLMLFKNPAIVWHDLATPTENLYNFHRDRTNSFISESARMVTANFRIKENEFRNLSARDLIKWRGYYWRIVSISDVDFSKSTSIKVKLIKFINPKPFIFGSNLPPIISAPEINSSIISIPPNAETETEFTIETSGMIANISIFADINNSGNMFDVTNKSDIKLKENKIDIKIKSVSGETEPVLGYIAIIYK